MNTATKLAAFAAVLATSFGVAAAVGAAVGPIDVSGDSADHGDDHSGETPVADAVSVPRGLSISQAGYRLELDTTVLDAAPAGAATPFTFRIADDRNADGAPLTEFDELHERPMHLIVLSRNLVDEHHLHPTMDETGTWSVDLPALAGGSYRVYADFQPTGADNLTLAADLAVTGDVPTVALPAPAGTDTVDGYTVTLSGTPVVGDSTLQFDVELDGQQITTEPYLGAAGHLIAIRSGDLAFLHVHPDEPTEAGTGTSTADDSSTITFVAEFPSAGTYRLFLDFAHDGVVRTAAFTLTVDDMAAMSHADTDEGGH